MAYTHGTTTWYSAKELTQEAQALAKAAHCPECDARLVLHGYNLCVSKEATSIQATAKCRRHTYRVTVTELL